MRNMRQTLALNNDDKKKYSFLFKREKHQKYKTGVPNLVLFLEKYGRRLKTTLTLEFF